HELAVAPPTLLDASGEIVHVMKKLDHLRRVVADALGAVGVRDRLGVVDDRLGFAIAQALLAGDDGVGKLRANRPGVIVESNESRFAETRYRFLQAAD